MSQSKALTDVLNRTQQLPNKSCPKIDPWGTPGLNNALEKENGYMSISYLLQHNVKKIQIDQS